MIVAVIDWLFWHLPQICVVAAFAGAFHAFWQDYRETL